MKLLKLEVEGYRSLRKISWTPGDLNVLIGPNGSGKTNLIRVLEFLVSCANGKLRDHIQREGGLARMVWDGRADPITVKALIGAPRLPFKNLPWTPFPEEWEGFTYEIQIAPNIMDGMPSQNIVMIQKEALRNVYRAGTDLNGKPVELIKRGGPLGAFFLGRAGPEALVLDDTSGQMVDAGAGLKFDETVLSSRRPTLPSNLQIFAYQSALVSWRVYQDLWPKVYAPAQLGGLAASIRQATVARYETQLSPDGQNLVAFLHTLYTSHREFKDAMNQAMSAAFGDDFEELIFAPAADQQIQMRVRWKSLNLPTSAADLSDGTLRFLFLVSALADPEPPPLVAIEEPELGLHPHMLPIIAEYAADAANRTQVILTTHSPEFLNAFRDVTPTTTVFDRVDGETRIQVLRDDDLVYWLKEYSLGEYAFFGGVSAAE